MALTPIKASYTLFRLDGGVDKLDTVTFEDLLKVKRFMPIDTTTDLSSYGWTSLVDINDFEFTNSTAANGDFMLCGMRIDKRSVPAAALNNEYRIALASELKRSGKDFLSRDRKQEIKEQIKLRLQARAIPVPKVIQCCFDASTKTMYVGSVSNSELELIADHIADTFDTVPVLLTPSERAEAVLPDITKQLNDIQSDTGNVDYTLWTEFMTWMWHMAETNQQLAPLNGHKYTYHVDGTLVIDEVHGGNVVNQVQVKTSDDNYDFFDIKYGMWKSKRYVRQITLCVEADEQDSYQITLNAKNPASLVAKTPNIRMHGEEVTSESSFNVKMSHFETVHNFVFGMYALYVKARFSPDRWAQEKTAIHTWLEASAPECERAGLGV